MRAFAIGRNMPWFIGFALLGACVGPSPLVGRDSSGAGSAGMEIGAGGDGAQSAGGTSRASKAVFMYESQLRDQGVGYRSYRCLPDVTLGTVAVPEVRVHRVALDGCPCEAPVYVNPSAEVRADVERFLRNEGICGSEVTPCTSLCICEELPASDAALEACRASLEDPAAPAGWCYLSRDPEIGDPELLAECMAPYLDGVRLFGEHTTEALFRVVSAQTIEVESSTPALHLPLGSPCVPEIERRPDFAGFVLQQAVVNTDNAACDSGLCLVNHFQGRVSCPYGQAQGDLDASAPGCTAPWSEEPVSTPVDAQRLQRSAERMVTCSCRCDGPGDGPFCECPATMECSPVIGQTGMPEGDALAGSYCIPRGTLYNPQQVLLPDTCRSERGQPEAASCDAPLPY
jgi:hypothetical protein